VPGGLDGARTRTLDVGGPVHAVEWGVEGPHLVLVHGLGGSHLDWIAVAPALARHHRVVAVDLPGFGRTPRLGRSSAVTANAEVVAGIARALGGDQVTLMGNSMGGLIALLAAHRHSTLIDRLVLVDPAVPMPLRARPDPLVVAGILASSLPAVGGRLVGRRGQRLGVEGLVEQTLRICCVDPTRVDPVQRAAIIAMAQQRRSAQPDGPDAYSQAARSLVRILVGARARAATRDVHTPMLVVHGRRDRLVHVGASRRLVAGRPERRLEVIEDCGHIPMIELPERFLATVRPWLEARRRSVA
jgi:pimeloyl-ACP methyl ester carboxylesterase